MKPDKFFEVFDFQYTPSQWEKIERAIRAQPGQHDTEKIREILELEARRYRIVPQLESKTQRGVVNLAHAKKVIRACEQLRSLLTEPAYSREYAFNLVFRRSECAAIANHIKKLQEAAEIVVANNSPLSKKIKQADPRRDKYLGIVCDLWVTTIHGPKTTSYTERTGQASGPFVEFLVLVAQPVLGQLTHNGAARFVKRWRKSMAV